jgi:hypothetical protein
VVDAAAARQVTASPTGVRDFSLLLPPGWVRFPIDSRVPLRVKNLVSDRMTAVPEQRRKAVRASLTRELTAVLETAARRGSIDVLLSVDPVAGQPVPASGLVTHLEGQGGGDVLDALVGTLVVGARGVAVRDLGIVEVAGAPAVRRLTTRRERVPAEGEAAGGVLTVTQVDHFVPIPDGSGLLVLTFSTPMEQLGPPLVALFDVIASSFRWVSS